MRAAARELVWHDEFDGPAGSPPDPRWSRFELGDGSDSGNPGWGNRELQRYTDRPANVAHDGHGNLAIAARVEPMGQYTPARIVTKGLVEHCHGRMEARARVPSGIGLRSAIWALGADIDSAPWPACGEIDVMEHVGSEPKRIFGTIHGPEYAGQDGFSGDITLQRAWPPTSTSTPWTGVNGASSGA
jgi:beta-glucanase (GH16 family)